MIDRMSARPTTRPRKRRLVDAVGRSMTGIFNIEKGVQCIWKQTSWVWSLRSQFPPSSWSFFLDYSWTECHILRCRVWNHKKKKQALCILLCSIAISIFRFKLTPLLLYIALVWLLIALSRSLRHILVVRMLLTSSLVISPSQPQSHWEYQAGQVPLPPSQC